MKKVPSSRLKRKGPKRIRYGQRKKGISLAGAAENAEGN
jgi:hypothetical protein